MITIRDCRAGDVDDMAAMAEARRVAYERFEPLFWKKAAASLPRHRAFLEHLVGDPRNLCLFAEDARPLGFLIATEARVPPVFDSGRTAMIDDFCVAEPSLWRDVGPPLLEAARHRLRESGFAQIVVVAGFKDLEKSAFLETQELSLASTWWTAPA